MSKNFFALLKLAELDFDNKLKPAKDSVKPKEETAQETKVVKEQSLSSLGLHYNIQIHLPATKDVEVYNAIFKSVKEHLIE